MAATGRAAVPLTNNLTLYFSPVCPYVQRVTIALHELGLITSIEPKVHTNDQSSATVDLVEIDLNHKPEWYLKDINPAGKVPALKLAGQSSVLLESAPLAEFLLQAHSPQALFNSPDKALQRYRGNLIVDVVNSSLIPAFYGLLRAKDSASQSEVTNKLIDAIKQINTHINLASPHGPYALGDEFSFVDVMSAGFLARFPVLQHYRGFTVPETPEFARFRGWRDAILARPSIKATTASFDTLIAFYLKFTK